jgi:hypothetical protein
VSTQQYKKRDRSTDERASGSCFNADHTSICHKGALMPLAINIKLHQVPSQPMTTLQSHF